MTRRELIAYFGFKVEGKPLEDLEKKLEAIKGRVEFLAGVELVKGLYELTERFTHFAEEVHAAATSAGITVEEFQKLSFAAAQSAVSQDEMTTSMARLGRQLYQARMGSEEAQKAFSDVGFTPEQVMGFRNSSQALYALADRFKEIQDPLKKQALTMQLLGRGSHNMVAYLSKGSAALKGLGEEAEGLGAVLSEHQIQSLVEVEQALQKISAVARALGATLASYLAPSIKTAIADMMAFYKANHALIELNLQNWVYNVTFALGFVYQAVKTLATAVLDLAKHFHLEGQIFPVIGTLVALVSGLLIATKAFGLLEFALGPTIKALQIFFGLLNGGKLLFGAAVEGVGYLTNSMWLLNAAAVVQAAPLWAIAAAIGAIVIGAHDLWAVLQGKSLSETWIGQFLNWVENLKYVGQLLKGILSQLTGGATEVFSVLSKVTSAFGGGTAVTAVQNINAVPALASAPTLGPVGQQGVAGSNYSVNAPITINVPRGTDPHVLGESVRDGVREHLDTVYRRTQQSLQTGQEY